jgi:hypothetical protein
MKAAPPPSPTTITEKTAIETSHTIHLSMTYEHFAVEDVVSDVLFRAGPVAIAGHKFRFIKLSPSLIEFGKVVQRAI